jgi:hypothetical protein
MKPYWTDTVLALGALVVFTMAIGCSGVGAQPPDVQDKTGSLPFSGTDGFELSKGTPIYVRLQQPISSTTAETGQSFSAVLDEPLMVNGRIVAPEGALVKGRVVAARKSGHLHDAGYLRVTLSSLSVNGREVPIQTSSMFVEGGNLKNRTLAYSGGGTGGHSLLGALAGGDKGDLVGSMVGTGGGTSAAYASGNKEVGFAAERRMSFHLIEPLNIS